MSNEETTFVPQTILRLLSTQFQQDDTRISSQALEATIEYIRIFTKEAIWRSEEFRRQAEADLPAEDEQTSTEDILLVGHLKSISKNLCMDF